MPPRLSIQQNLRLQLCFYPFPPRFLLPYTPQRYASILQSLSDNRGAYSKKIRRGRGPASGKGKTSGRGHKGQKQHGKVPRNFEGGQTPLRIVHGEHGFKNPKPANLTTVPLTRIQSWITQNRISPAHPITIKELHQSRCANRPKNGIKLLATSAQADGRRTLSTNTKNGTASDPPLITYPINITVSRASKAAIAAVEAAGGTVTTRYYSPQAITKILQGKMHPTESLLGAGPKSGTRLVNDEGADAVQGEIAATAKSADPPTPPQDLPKTSSGGTGLAASFVGSARSSAHRFRLPDPFSRKDLEYYRDPAHRGYLSHQVPAGYTPSLFWKTPGTGIQRGQVKGGGKGKRKSSSENRIW